MLAKFRYRSDEQEFMDNVDIEEKALQVALSDISRVNKWLGGNTITIHAIHKLLKDKDLLKELTILDLGCGSGEMLRSIADSLKKENRDVKLIGVDLNEKSLGYAKKLSVLYPEILYTKQDILDMNTTEYSYDIIICTLTLHHLKNEEIITLLSKATQLANIGVIINDLHRSPIAYYLFKIFSFFFIRGFVAKNDGLVSIKRGFKKRELLNFAEELNLKKHQIDWKWAFRYLWVINKGNV
ncbi:methyltransferase domain-containing protein [Aquimarina sediminis]|uniref:methyltransferase domain-containing protein n=1 Tax=Aquimarina sediminis TaxID=2070536 RepID=UPI000CA041B4|nr:methyltransferase domain-containing protein [Aquimarina sediminis]